MNSSEAFMPTVDLVIIGGGCAGLSLAMQLTKLKSLAPTTVILESRSEYRNDRTWCFWRDEKIEVDTLVRHQWTKVRVRSPEDFTVLDCEAAPYQLVSSHDFYSNAEATLADNPKTRLFKQTSVLGQPQKTGDMWSVRTNSGNFSARVIVDTRPDPHLQTSHAQMWQSFYGEEIECDSDVFDPAIADLMDFSDQCSEVIKFVYILPMSKRRALVEMTVFSSLPANLDTLKTECTAAVSRSVRGYRYQNLRSEHGILPMGNLSSAQVCDSSYVRVGLHAGAARASTGYAFQRIQRWAALCSAKLGTGASPVSHPRDPVLLQWMDYLFLRVLQRRPELAPELFVTVFKNAAAERLIRFLSDNGTFFDYVSVIRALPAKPFITEILKIIFGGTLARTQKAAR